ncbi:MAG: Na+/H+ antiporter subunit E [Anaerolineae bacterium]|nr:Na+/H+ antiporter subunit E [Anaerolineae bacterium]
MSQTLFLSFPMALLWMIFARQLSWEGFVIGYIFGFAVLMVIRINTTYQDIDQPIRPAKIPSQLIALVVYIVRLAVDVFFSGIDVAKRVINPKLPIDPDTRRVSTQDKSNDDLISALSAHSITITPGELVIDFETDENGQTVMLVHTLDKEESNMEKLNRDQHNRLKLIRQILGLDEISEDKGL